MIGKSSSKSIVEGVVNIGVSVVVENGCILLLDGVLVRVLVLTLVLDLCRFLRAGSFIAPDDVFGLEGLRLRSKICGLGL